MQTPVSETVSIDAYSEWENLVWKNNWTDGLPLGLPTEEKVTSILDYLRRDPKEIVGLIPPVYRIATVEQVAIQCAMAGCLPEHVPIVLAAADAMLDPKFNLHGVQSTTHPCAPLVIVSGPIARQLNFNARNGAFGGGGHADAAVGRAVRLILWNLGGGKPSTNDMAPLGGPQKYAFCVSENTEQSPFGSLHTDFGYQESDNAVTVFACVGPYPTVINGSPNRVLRLLCDGFAAPTHNCYHAAGQLLFALSVRPAVALANAGYTKQSIRQFIFDHARLSVGRLKQSGALEGPLTDMVQRYWGEQSLADVRIDVDTAPDDTLLPLVLSVDDIRVIVTGGDTQWFGAYLPGWGNYGGLFVTRPVSLPAG